MGHPPQVIRERERDRPGASGSNRADQDGGEPLAPLSPLPVKEGGVTLVALAMQWMSGST